MRSAYLPLLAASAFACPIFVAMAQFQEPVANLPLTCLEDNAIGQPQNNCTGVWRYQLPISDQIVVLRNNGTWARAATLAGTDTLTVCALPLRPGEYSGCRDESGVRRLIQLPKSQVFANSPTPVSGARVLDLSRVPVVVTEPGLYVLDRSWNVVSPTPDGAIVVTASNVDLDLRGFELSVYESGVNASGQNFAIRNGRVTSHLGVAVQVSGEGSIIEQVTALVTDYGTTVSVSGRGSVLANSVVSLSQGAAAVSAGDGTIVRNNQITSVGVGVSIFFRSSVVDNDVSCGADCVTVEGTDNIVSRNKFSKLFHSHSYGLHIRGNYNNAKDNVVLTRCIGANSTPSVSVTAIFVDGRGNTLLGNLVPAMSCGGISGFGNGIFFAQDGNFYGDNIVFTSSPFHLGATVQTDLGGNVGVSP